MKNYLVAAAAAFFTFAAGSASAQVTVYEDYQPSDMIWSVTFVDLEPGTQDLYLEGLQNTWVAANEVAKDLGHISDYAIYANQFGAGADFDLMLVVQMDNTSDLAPSQDRYNEFMAAWGEERQDESNSTVIELYNEIRTLQSEHLIRRIDFN